MSEKSFWTAEFEGTEKQVAYAKDVRVYLAKAVEKFHKDAIESENHDADAIRDAVMRGIVKNAIDRGCIRNDIISAGRFLNTALGYFMVSVRYGRARTNYDLICSDALERLAKLGGYDGLTVHCDDSEYDVWGTEKREREHRELAEYRSEDNPLLKPYIPAWMEGASEEEKQEWLARKAAKKRAESQK